MKNIQIGLFLVLSCALIYGCSSKNDAYSERDNLIAYNDSVADWIGAPEFMPNLKKQVKKVEDMDGYLDYGMLKIAKHFGYKSINETIALFEKYSHDSTMVKAMKKAEMQTDAALQKIEQYKVQLTKKHFSVLSKIVDDDDLRIKRDMNRNDYQILVESEQEEAEKEGISVDSLKDVPIYPVPSGSKDSAACDSVSAKHI